MKQEVQKLTEEQKIKMENRGKEWTKDVEHLQKTLDDFRFKYPVTGYSIMIVGNALLVKPMFDNHWLTYGYPEKTE